MDFDPQAHDLIVGSSKIIGYAEGTFIKAAYDEELFMKKVGADGFGTRIRNANEAGYFEITLLSSSPSNDDLNELAQQDRGFGTGIVPVFLKDRNGNATAHAEQAWIVKPADLERGKELGDVTWKLDTLKLDLIQGGTIQAP